jgi:hypothetical protein
MRRSSIALVVALLAGGCGGSSKAGGDVAQRLSGDAAAVAASVHTLADLGRRRDAAGICRRILARSLVVRLRASGVDCASELGRALQSVGGTDLRVTAVHVTDGSAAATIASTVGGRRRTDRLNFVREAGAWRAVSLGR